MAIFATFPEIANEVRQNLDEAIAKVILNRILTTFKSSKITPTISTVQARIQELKNSGQLEVDCSGGIGFTKGSTWTKI